MAAPAITENNVELLMNGQYPGQWMPQGPLGNWEMNPAGELIQNSPVGTRRGGSGTIIAQKIPVSSSISGLQLTCRAGSQHQVGVVFNLVDEHNFCAFCIDVHSKKEDGYGLLAFSVNDGNYDVISKQSYKGKLPDVITFTLRQSGADLMLQFNDTLSYIWSDMFLFGKRIGLYSYKNTDATFLSVKLITSALLEIVQKPLVAETTMSVVSSTPEQLDEPIASSENGITNFLSIRQPASKIEIEFTEVFTVPLDSFYSSLYQNSNLNSAEQSIISGGAEVQLLDLRVKRWYRDLKTVREDIASARKDLAYKQERIRQAEEQRTKEMSDADYAVLEASLMERRSDARKVLRTINNLRDREGLLMREIRVNGYSLAENTTIDVIKDLGYDFHLVGQAMAHGEYDPVEFEPNLNLADDNAWNDSLKKLHQHLFDTKTITEKGISLYQKENELLRDFKSCPPLVEAERQFNADIERENDIKPLYENIVTDVENELGEWQADKQTLERRQEAYNHPYDPHPEVWANHPCMKDFFERTVGWFDILATPAADSFNALYPVHPKFKNSVFSIGKGRRMKLNRFVADVYAEYSYQQTDQQMNTYVGTIFTVNSVIYQGLGLYFPEIGVDFYHRSGTAYSYQYISPDWLLSGGLAPTFRSTYDSQKEPPEFFKAAQQVCDYFIGKINAKLEAARQRVREIEIKISTFQHGLDDLLQNGLSRERQKFVEKWNDPATNLTTSVSTKVHYPDEDPLAEFLASISGNSDENAKAIETYFFTPTPDGFYNQNGLSLQEFMKGRSTDASMQDVICVFPVFDSPGHISTEMVKAVKNPNPSTKTPSLPTIKFVESYRVEVGWLGYGLGELSHSFNLFPGESKELVIEKTTKLSTKSSATTSSEENTSTHLTSSFEDNLQNELAVGEKAAIESSSMNKNDSSQSSSTEETSSLDFHTSASASGGIGFVSGKAEMGLKIGSSSKRNSAFSASQAAEQKRASNQSKDILSKNISNTVRKVASETSQNNKLSFSAVSSREYEESTTNREVIKLQNPNVGKTVNYNFFQVQNLFGVTTKLIDVQIVIDSGVEMAKGTGINEVRVYDLEEFGKIFANSDGGERSAALASIVARQVFKHYGDFLPGITSGNGSVIVRGDMKADKEMLEVLNFSNDESESVFKDKIDRIKTALSYLKSVPFVFREKILSEEANVAVNCAAYHMEAQLGFLPATETYLENRREIETEKQRALVEQIKEQTKAGIFFQELPGGVTTLNLAVPKTDVKKEVI